MGWLHCFCEQMGPWELEEREEIFFWLIRVLSQHLWAYLVKKLCFSSQGLFSNSSCDLPERELKGMTWASKCVFRSQEKSPSLIWY